MFSHSADIFFDCNEDGSPELEEKIKKALEDAGLTEVSVSIYDSEESDEE